MTYRRQSSRVSKTLGPNDPRSHRNPQGGAMPLQFLGDGMKLSSTREVTLDLATDPALEFSGTTPDGQVRVKVKSNGGVTRDSNGLSITTGSGLTLDSGGTLVRAFSVSATYTTTANAGYGEFVRCDPSGGGFTVTLPPSTTPNGRDILIKNITSSTNTITVDANTGQTFEGGAATRTITRAYGWIWIVNVSSIWYVIAENNSTGILLTDGDKGDITVSSSGTNWQIDADAVGTTEIAGDSVTFAKMQNITTDRLIGRDTASTGDPEEISVGGGLEFTGSTGIQRSALTGDVTASAGSNATTIANNAVTFAKMQTVSADILLGNDSSGTAVQEITCTSAARSVLDDMTTAAMLVTLGATGRLLAKTVYTTGTTATHNYNSAATSALIVMVGGGGGGGGVSGGVGQAASAGGGGAGGYTVKYLSLGGVTSATYTVGVLGTGGSAGANNGNNGTASTWTHNAVVYSAGLGSGGTAMATGTSVSAAAGGAGGSTTNGDSDSIGGATGMPGIRLSGTQVIASQGGASFWGGGGVGGTNSAGGAATPYGAGGGGASTIGNTNRAGGDGANGVIVVWEYS